MPRIEITVDAKALVRYADYVFSPGADQVGISGEQVLPEWCDAGCDPGVTVSQAEVLRDLVTYGVTLVVEEDGQLSVKEQ